jgi:protein gp37
MSANTKIEWTDATWNPLTGCSVTSPGCKHCYAMQLAGTRLKHHESRAGLTQDTSAGPVWTGEIRLNPQWLDQPIRWTKPRMIFVCAHSDLFHEIVSDELIDMVFGIMWACLYGRNGKPGHIFQVLTKRAARMRHYFSTDRRAAWARAAVNYGGGIDPDGIYDQVMGAEGPHPRIWLGVSVEDQKRADERIPELLATPAAVRWVSAEPLLGPVLIDTLLCEMPEDEDGAPYLGPIDWVVVGGESGPKARPMHLSWARDLRDQCAEAGVPFLFKQWGEWIPAGQSLSSGGIHTNIREFGYDEIGRCRLHRMGKKTTGRLLDSVQHDGYPKAQGGVS